MTTIIEPVEVVNMDTCEAIARVTGAWCPVCDNYDTKLTGNYAYDKRGLFIDSRCEKCGGSITDGDDEYFIYRGVPMDIFGDELPKVLKTILLGLASDKNISIPDNRAEQIVTETINTYSQLGAARDDFDTIEHMESLMEKTM